MPTIRVVNAYDYSSRGLITSPPLTGKSLGDISDVRRKLEAIGAEGRVPELIDLVIRLLGDVRDTNTSLSVRLQNALRALYGRTSEKISSNQLALLLSVLGDEVPADLDNRRRAPLEDFEQVFRGGSFLSPSTNALRMPAASLDLLGAAHKPRRNGATHLVMTPIQFLARISSLIPPPRFPLQRLSGVFGPRCAFRAAVVPRGLARGFATPTLPCARKKKKRTAKKPDDVSLSPLAASGEGTLPERGDSESAVRSTTAGKFDPAFAPVRSGGMSYQFDVAGVARIESYFAQMAAV